MKIKNLIGIRGARDKPTDSYAGSAFSFLFGRSTSGKPVNERTAMQTTAVYACVRILSEAIASLPLNIYKYTDTGKERVYDHPLYHVLHNAPNEEMTSFVFRETLMSHLLIWGNAYAQIIRDGRGQVLALYPLLPDKMQVDRAENGELYYIYSSNSEENPNFKETGDIILRKEEVLHIPGLGFDGLIGYSPIAMVKNAVGMTIACEEYGASFFANGATPGGVLEHPGVLKDPAKVRDSWHSVYGGSKNASKVAVLEEGMKYQQIGIPPEEAQFLETRKFQINEIARMYRIPPHMVGDLEKSSFSNIEQQSLEFVKYTLDPWVCRWEQAMMKDLLLPQEKKDYFIKMNVDGLLRGDYQSRMNVYVFSGKKIAVECIYNEKDELFVVSKIMPLSVDRRISNQKRGFIIDGIVKFIESGRGNYSNKRLDNDNEKLIVQFKNNINSKSALQKQDELFEELFGKWQDGLDESMKNEKERVGKVVYSSFSILDQQLVLTVEEYKNNDIDGLENDKNYIIEDVDSRGNSFYFDIGTYHGISYEDDETLLIIDLDKKVQMGKVRPLLRKHCSVMEDFRANISAYKRQHYAIRALHDDNYSSKNLKDILLNLDEPTYTPFLQNIKFSKDTLNVSQREAIRKALYSDSISLIQGPPGTGKTTVIKEIVRQILMQINKFDDTSRILVVSQSHTAVDNIIEGLVDIDEGKLDIIRIGRAENISPKVEETCTMNAIRKKMFTEIKEKSDTYIEHQSLLYANITEQKALDRWKRIKDIQKDWINRCSNLETLDYQVVKSATIIAGTCVGFLSNDFVKELDFDYVIIDEAAKATTPELLVSIIKSKKIILVGDQNQLPAYADQDLSPIIAKLTKEPKYRLFDLLFNVLPDTHKQILTVQYRMRRNIGNLISQVFYEGKIATEVDDKNRMHPIKKFAGKSIIWVDTSMMDKKDESRLKGGSYCNYTENNLIKKLLENFKREGVLSQLDIGIITGYRGQKDLIRKSVNNSGYDRIAKGIDINTLDAFQGRENDVIIYSTVRTKNSIGFQKEKERVNVAFSRAKNLLIICGDMDFFYRFDDPDNKFIEIIDYICEHEDECLIIPGGEI